MELLKFTYIGVIIGSSIMLLSAILLNIYIWKGYLAGKKIKEKTYQLSKSLTNEKVEEYIKLIDSVEIPPRNYHWNMIKAGYEIVKMNGEIEINLIEELKIAILSKGILV